MTEKRKSDRQLQSRFRTNRFFMNDGKWFFTTREGTVEGPFWELREAESKLRDYIKIMNSGFMPRDSTLELEPINESK